MQLKWTQEDMRAMANCSPDTSSSEATKLDLIESAERLYHREIAKAQMETSHMPKSERQRKMESLEQAARDRLDAKKAEIERCFISDEDFANAGPETSIGRFRTKCQEALSM